VERANLDPMDGLASTFRVRLRPTRLARVRAAALRRFAVAGLVALLAAAGWVWLRDSPLVEVRDVVVTGVSSSQDTEIRAALERSASGMTTLHMDTEALRRAASPYTSVAGLSVDADLPHKVTIEVDERAPAALVAVGGERIPAADGGLLLRGVRPDPALPVVRMDEMPSGSRIDDRRVRAAVGILAAAPAELRDRLERARSGPRGLQLELRDGPDLIFGSGARVRAKWAAATRVLADSGAKGATYLDLRLPERPVAGGLPPLTAQPSTSPRA